MKQKKRIALVAHDQRKADLIDWATAHLDRLVVHDLYATGTTGHVLMEQCGLNITRMKSGPLGGDQQLGAKIVAGELDVLIFFWDPMTAQPHDVDVKALLRMAVLYNVVVACNRSSADFFITSPLFDQAYQQKLKDYGDLISAI